MAETRHASPTVEVVVEVMGERHEGAVREVHAAGMATGHATFEAEPPPWPVLDASRLPDHRLVALGADGAVLGWAASSAVSDRCAHAEVVEHSVHVHPDALVTSTEAGGTWTVQAGSSRRTAPAWPCTPPPGSASSAPGSGSGGRRTGCSPGGGVTWSTSSGAAPPSSDATTAEHSDYRSFDLRQTLGEYLAPREEHLRLLDPLTPQD